MQDILKSKGIYKNGFGTVPKLVIYDREIKIGAKGLYCYICSYAGSGEIAFPYRTRICEELNISEKTYQAYMKELTSNSYISVKQKKRNNQFSYNVYTIINTVKKEKIRRIVKNEPLLRNILDQIDSFSEIEDIDVAGYGKIPKMISTDRTISIKSKAVFGLISVYNTYKSKKLRTAEAIDILGISEDTYYKSLNELEKAEFLKKKEFKTKKGYRKQILIINVERQSRDELLEGGEVEQ